MTGLQRISRDQMLMQIAEIIAQRGTCSRAKVGCVVSRDARVLSTGYNGVPSGLPHCNHEVDSPCTQVVHAEVSAIAFAAKYGVAVENATIHVTRVPCFSCAGIIINSGVSRVMWLDEHRDMTGLELLAGAGVDVIRYTHG